MSGQNPHIEHALFERLYAEYKLRFIRIAQSYVRNEMVAEDIVTDSFLYYWQHRDTLEITSNIPAYLLGSVRHGCLAWLRNEKNRLKIRQQIHTTAYSSIQIRIAALEDCDPEQIFASEIATIVREQTENMPDPMRRIFLLSRLEGKTYRQISQTTGISERNVKASMQKALEIMRQALGDYLPALFILLVLNRMN